MLPVAARAFGFSNRINRINRIMHLLHVNEVGTRYAAMFMAVLVRPVLLQLRTLPNDHTSQPGRLSLFQGVRAGNGRAPESGAMQS